MADPRVIPADGPLLVFGGPYSNLQATQAVLAEAAGLSLRRVRGYCLSLSRVSWNYRSLRVRAVARLLLEIRRPASKCRISWTHEGRLFAHRWMLRSAFS